MCAADSDELAQYLDSLQREDCYRVDEILKESDCETTQQVSFIGANGAPSRALVRKLIKRESGLGKTYERIYSAQHCGQRFKHVPDILECYRRDDLLVVIMELVQGETLQDAVLRSGPSFERTIDVFPRLCDAVRELHEDFNPPIIHRDLKPSNIILSQRGLVIIDYGIAREFREGAPSDTTHFGTRPFAPPEQFGFGQTTVRSDVYALGMVLYFCLTGEIAPRETVEAAFADSCIPADMQALIAQATALDPADRFASVKALKSAFLQTASTNASTKGDPAKSLPASAVQAPMAQAPSVQAPSAIPHPPSTSAQQDAGIKQPALFGQGVSPAPAVTSSSPESSDAQRNGVNAVSPHAPAPFGDYFANGGRHAALGVIWNLVVFLTLGLFLAGCIASFADPQTSGMYPLWFNIPSYLVLMPLFFIASAWMLVDKRRLRNRFPVLQKFRTTHWIILCATSFFVMFFGIGALLLILGPTAV